MQLTAIAPDSISGLIIADFAMFLLPLVARSRGQWLCKSYRNFLSRCSFCLGGILGLFFRDACVIGLSGLFRPLCFPLGISVEIPVLEIAGLESRSGLKMGLSGTLGFAWNESRHVNSRGAFPTANVLVNLLKEETIKGSPTLVTGHPSRLVSGLERRLLHRSVAHYQSTYSSTGSPLKSSSSPP